MAVTFDTKFEKGADSQSSPFSFVSNAGTVAGSVGSNTNRVLIGIVSFTSDTLTITNVAMTWAGNAMTEIGTGLNSPGGFSMHIFGIKGDANVTTGAQTLSCSWTGSAVTVCLGAISLYNCDTTTGWQNSATNTGTSTSASLAITTVSGNMVVAGRLDENATSATITSGTQDWDERALNGNHGGGHKASASTSETISWTLGSSVGWAMKGADVIAASGGTIMTPSQGTPTFTGQAPILAKAILMPDEP